AFILHYTFTLLHYYTFIFISGFIRAQVPPPVTPISTGRVVTSNGLSVHRLSYEGQVIVVSWANYGRRDKTTCSHGRPVSQLQNVHCTWSGSMNYVTTRCNGTNMCEINTNMVCTCDPSVCTYLDITFTCVPAIHSVTCQESQANLQCGEGQVIVVSWVNYGRRDNTTCSHGRPVSQIQNVHCSSPSSAEYNNCTVGASNTVFGDPCGGTYKYLEVVYDCQDPE
uniref:SUEL-type lectin domain-containing protein n=1 Tax=Maylandia zebra TaxID=106582 RepID=A0A3P9DNY3_9CICH